MTTTRDRLLQDLRDQIVAHLHGQHYSVNPKETIDSILTGYLNLLHRRIVNAPRAARRSRAMTDRFQALATELVRRVIEIEKTAASGGDLNAYLHYAIRNPAVDDMLLNDWGFHHFHLGPARGDRASTGRDELLYAIVTSDELLLLDVMRHQEFSSPLLMEIAHCDFPEAIAHARLEGISNVEPKTDRSQRGAWRNSGFMILTQVSDGTVYGAIGGGFTKSGLSFRVRRAANRIMNQVVALADMVDGSSDNLGELLSTDEAGEPLADVLSLIELDLRFDGLAMRDIGLRDRSSGKRLARDPGGRWILA